MSANNNAGRENALPTDIDRILSYVAMEANGYNNDLNYREINKLKGDMMNCPQRWRSVNPEQIKNRCLELGMTEKDAKEVAYLRQWRLEGHRLAPRYGYRDFKFPF